MRYRFNADPDYRFFDFFSSVVDCQGWLQPGYVLNLYWFRVEIVKFWEAT
jgi:hypothetical protein